MRYEYFVSFTYGGNGGAGNIKISRDKVIGSWGDTEELKDEVSKRVHEDCVLITNFILLSHFKTYHCGYCGRPRSEKSSTGAGKLSAGIATLSHRKSTTRRTND